MEDKTHELYLQEVEGLKTEGEPFYWYTELPEEFFIESLIPGSIASKKKYVVDEFDLINTAKYITINACSGAESILATSILELYHRGYVNIMLDIWHDRKHVRLFFGEEYNSNFHFMKENSLLQSYHNYSGRHNMSVYLSKKGEEWLYSIKEKYPELFEVALTLEQKQYVPPKGIPEGYSHKGSLKAVVEEGKPWFDWKFVEE